MKVNRIGKFLKLSIFLAYLIIGLGYYFGDRFFWLDLLSHFYFLYAILGFFIVVYSLYAKEKIASVFSSILFIFIIFQISHAQIFVNHYEGKADIFYLNSHYFVNEPDKILAEITERKAKYVMIVELNEELHGRLKSQYKNHIYHSERALSLGFYTDEDIISSQVHTLTYPVLQFETEKFSGLLVHPLPPFTPESSKKQKKNFSEIHTLFQNIAAEKKMIIGDFNSTLYSQVFRKYFHSYHYQAIYTRGGFGPLRMPIDYALGNSDFFETHSTNLTVSDHLPLLINFREE